MKPAASPRILIVEDQEDIIEILELHLTREGYQVESLRNGAEALQAWERQARELVILDWMLPGMDGLELCKRIRQSSSVPILMLTARDEELDKVLGLEMGADDYLTKPFGVRELIARVRALLRRSGPQLSHGPVTYLELGELRISEQARTVHRKEQLVELSPKEFDLLLFLARNPDRVFSRTDLLNQVWGYAFDGYERTVDSHVQKLRKKLEPDPGNPVYIVTAWGVGYRFGDTGA